MKRAVVVVLAAWVSVMAPANLMTNGEFDDGGAGWSFNGSADDWSTRGNGASIFREDDGVNICAIGWSDYNSIWAVSNAVIQANTMYMLTVKVRTAGNPAGTDWGDGVILTMQDATNGWANIVADTSFIFPDTDIDGLTSSDVGPWNEFSISFHSAATPDIVGHTIAVGVRLDDNNNRTDWGNYGWIYVDSVTLVPEPATLALLGLGALVPLKKRKA